jgi:hypothetical protein
MENDEYKRPYDPDNDPFVDKGEPVEITAGPF